ncbi:hypothetical protein [Paenibacillus polymyxa]|uniref:hypothetical protein n=1 Tax=Paenibacillus polymyxa TaxID=1406 RepID=UPI000737AE0E|nr:hypothetical protein [Paenibacillus polymyxa]
MADIWDVDDWVENAASLPVRRFYPSAVANFTGLPLEQVFTRLLHLVQGGALVLLYEIRCPEYDCARTVKTVSDKELLKFDFECDIHGEFEVTPGMIFPVFEFNPEFKKRMISKKKRKSQPTLKPALIY